MNPHVGAGQRSGSEIGSSGGAIGDVDGRRLDVVAKLAAARAEGSDKVGRRTIGLVGKGPGKTEERDEQAAMKRPAGRKMGESHERLPGVVLPSGDDRRPRF